MHVRWTYLWLTIGRHRSGGEGGASEATALYVRITGVADTGGLGPGVIADRPRGIYAVLGGTLHFQGTGEEGPVRSLALSPVSLYPMGGLVVFHVKPRRRSPVEP